MRTELRRLFTFLIPVICITYLLLFFIITGINTQNSGEILSESFNDIYTAAFISPFQEIRKKSLNDQILNTLSRTNLPFEIKERIRNDVEENGDFINELSAILDDDPSYWILVDKNNSLSPNYTPHDLVDLATGRPAAGSNNMLSKTAYEAVLEIITSAAREGYTLTIISAYRSFEYQSRIYTYWVTQEGQLEADRVSARPGHSQHQLGLTVDFNMLDNEFAKTQEGIWLEANAHLYGWSLSYPDGYESVTGYRWESWHYRYVGKKLAQFINKYFNGIQQYALVFIHEFNRDY